jgi:hypothetical protein
MSENYIQRLVEARAIESIKKKIPLKLATIAKTLGDPIVEQSGDIIGDDDIPILDEESIVMQHLGYAYDHLSAGVNLQVQHWIYGGEDGGTLKCYYEGKVVFHEENKELQAFVPSKQWEAVVDKLYAKSSKVQTEREEASQPEKEKILEKKGRDLLARLKSLWGNLK